ncbi:unnamed protein product, partial [marine sediment metagenome]
LKQMKPEWLVGTSMLGYGCTLTVGIGIPIPILSEEILRYTMVSDAAIFAPIVDYSEAYPQRKPDILAEVSYAELKGGHITIQGKDVPTASLSSYPKGNRDCQYLERLDRKRRIFAHRTCSPSTRGGVRH